jgi:PAS domain-containing protein/two-component sensor histidine kinase
MVDLKTIFVCVILVEILLTLALFVYWKTQKTYPGFYEWILALFVTSVGNILFALRGVFSDFVTITIANTLTVLSFILFLDAVKLYFTNRTFRRETYLVSIPLMMVLYFFTEYVESPMIRNSIVSLSAIIAMSLTIHVLLRESDSNEKLFSKLLAIGYALLILTFVGRIAEWSLIPGSRNIFNPSLFNIFLMLIVLVGSIGTTLLFLLLNFQKMARELDAAKIESHNFADRYSLAVSSAKAGLWDMDLKTGLIYWNDSLETLLGPETDIKKKLLEIWNSFDISEDDKSNPKKICTQTADGTYLATEFSLHHQKEGLLHLMGYARIVCNDTGSSRVIGLIYDITPQRKAENALKEANRKLNLLTSITRHDILNCVNVVNGFAEILVQELDDSEMRKKAENIAKSGAMITHLISFTAQYQNLGVKDPIWQDISLLLKDDEFKSLAEGKSLTYPEPGIFIYADEMLKKVLYNLMENSIRHGEKVSSFSFSYAFSADGLTVVYQDDGIGIPEDKKEKIFEKGYGKHTGLGLFFCREVLEITVLKIRENGVHGEGARFEIIVPLDSFKRM